MEVSTGWSHMGHSVAVLVVCKFDGYRSANSRSTARYGAVMKRMTKLRGS